MEFDIGYETLGLDFSQETAWLNALLADGNEAPRQSDLAIADNADVPNDMPPFTIEGNSTMQGAIDWQNCQAQQALIFPPPPYASLSSITPPNELNIPVDVPAGVPVAVSAGVPVAFPVPVAVPAVKRGRGRPPGSKNKIQKNFISLSSPAGVQKPRRPRVGQPISLQSNMVLETVFSMRQADDGQYTPCIQIPRKPRRED